MRKVKTLPSQKKLQELFDYRNGELYWKEKRSTSIDLSKPAGNIDKFGYRTIKIEGQTYKAHRLVWKYHCGKDPKEFIDHIDGNRSNNNMENLREATTQQNGYNRGPSKNNKLGIKGVCKYKNKYIAEIVINGKRKYLGFFDTIEEARLAREESEIKFFKEFSVLNRDNDKLYR
tara:strand:+ start:173 stop:694 length:522 start_codon:yes stop_codon:yes gene_type:complete